MEATQLTWPEPIPVSEFKGPYGEEHPVLLWAASFYSNRHAWWTAYTYGGGWLSDDYDELVEATHWLPFPPNPEV